MADLELLPLVVVGGMFGFWVGMRLLIHLIGWHIRRVESTARGKER